ncbi:MAG: response regulator, partial [Pyrinomonadaceae bacterium]|nr:response regulator [Pyrinomonadaceae bacterium]
MTKRKLLLADDSITIQKVVNLTFADEGIEVVAFGNGSLAIEQLDEVKPDLVLADVHMPGLNGYEVCERVKQSPNFSKVPVMLLVGSFEPFDENEANRVGADDYLTKPFQSIKQLINKVTALLNHSSENTVETAPLTPIVEEQFNFDDYDAGESQSKNSLAENSFGENSSFGDGLKSKFVDSGMDDKMIETNSFNWFTPKTPEVQNDFDVAEKVDENQGVSYQTTYENPPIEVNQTVPLSFSDVQEITANSGFASPQDEWSVAEKDNESLSEANQYVNLKVDEVQPDNQNNVDIINEKGFDFEPSSIP